MPYLLRRFLVLLLTGWAALTLNFVLPRLMPGNPIEAMLARYQGKLSAQAVGALEIQFGLNTHQSYLAQYFTYLGHMLTGTWVPRSRFSPPPSPASSGLRCPGRWAWSVAP